MVTRDGVWLDRSVEPWVGKFPGLGEVTVASDGATTVALAGAGGEHDEVRYRALIHGWAEPLSWMRQGYVCLTGLAATPSDAENGCLVLQGDATLESLAAVALAELGWSFLADYFIPCRWIRGVLTAFPRRAPMLTVHPKNSRSASLRPGSDAMILDVPRCGQPQQVMANVILRSAAHGDTTLKDLRGVDRFTAAARARVSGLFVQVPDGDKGPLAAHLEMASLPWAEMGIGRDVTLRDWSMLTRWCEQQGLTACH